jgi:hypothetical protein
MRLLKKLFGFNGKDTGKEKEKGVNRSPDDTLSGSEQTKGKKQLFKFSDGDWLQRKPAAWPQVIRHLKEHEGMYTYNRSDCYCNRLYIPVTRDSFDFANIEKEKRAVEEYDIMKKIKRFVNHGYIYTHEAILDKEGNIEVCYCLEYGMSADDDGYGAETDIWLIAKLDLNGKYIERFNLKYWRYIH